MKLCEAFWIQLDSFINSSKLWEPLPRIQIGFVVQQSMTQFNIQATTGIWLLQVTSILPLSTLVYSSKSHLKCTAVDIHLRLLNISLSDCWPALA